MEKKEQITIIQYKGRRKPIRLWADGCFDMMHYGHANALRQAKELGDVLVVGVHTDAEILRHKGPPILTEQERYAMVRGCKWVDEVVEAAPYVTQLTTMDKYNIDFCVHGDDITTDENGVDTYKLVKEAGRYKTIARTKGVSTTQLVGRMLLMTKNHLSEETFKKSKELSKLPDHQVKHMADMQALNTPRGASCSPVPQFNPSPYTGSHLLPTITLISKFAVGTRLPEKDDVKVYIHGSFDLFHAGHVEALRQAKAMGTYLIVGIHSDEIVNRFKGRNFPILQMMERVLSVLQCRYVDEVITGAPWYVTQEVVDSLGVDIVASGSVHDFPERPDLMYEYPRKKGIFKTFNSESKLTTVGILNRIIAHRLQFEERNRKKQEGEVEYLKKI